MTTQQPILHLALLNLRQSPGLPAGKPDEADIQALLSAFSSLAEIDGVLHLGAVRAASEDSTHTLGLFALLRGAQALEEFGTHPSHIEYLQSAVLPLVSELATADVVVARPPTPDRADWLPLSGRRLLLRRPAHHLRLAVRLCSTRPLT
jgi:hypothetical protein